MADYGKLYTRSALGNYLAAERAKIERIVDVTASVSLTEEDSGSVFLLDSTSATAITLPLCRAGAVGVTYKFVVKTANTAGYTIVTGDITDSTGDVFVGGLDQSGTGGASSHVAAANENTITLDSDATNGGGSVGSYVECTMISATQWLIHGFVVTADADGTGAALLSNAD